MTGTSLVYAGPGSPNYVPNWSLPSQAGMVPPSAKVVAKAVAPYAKGAAGAATLLGYAAEPDASKVKTMQQIGPSMGPGGALLSVGMPLTAAIRQKMEAPIRNMFTSGGAVAPTTPTQSTAVPTTTTTGEAKYVARQTPGTEPQYAQPAVSAPEVQKSHAGEGAGGLYTLNDRGEAAFNQGMVPPGARVASGAGAEEQMSAANQYARQNRSGLATAQSEFDLARHGVNAGKTIAPDGTVTYTQGTNPYVDLKFADQGGRTTAEIAAENTRNDAINYQAAMERAGAGMPSPQAKLQEQIQSVMDMPTQTLEDMTAKRAAIAVLDRVLKANDTASQAGASRYGHDTSLTAAKYTANAGVEKTDAAVKAQAARDAELEKGRNGRAARSNELRERALKATTSGSIAIENAMGKKITMPLAEYTKTATAKQAEFDQDWKAAPNDAVREAMLKNPEVSMYGLLPPGER